MTDEWLVKHARGFRLVHTVGGGLFGAVTGFGGTLLNGMFGGSTTSSVFFALVVTVVCGIAGRSIANVHIGAAEERLAGEWDRL